MTNLGTLQKLTYILILFYNINNIHGANIPFNNRNNHKNTVNNSPSLPVETEKSDSIYTMNKTSDEEEISSDFPSSQSISPPPFETSSVVGSVSKPTEATTPMQSDVETDENQEIKEAQTDKNIIITNDFSDPIQDNKNQENSQVLVSSGVHQETHKDVDISTQTTDANVPLPPQRDDIMTSLLPPSAPVENTNSDDTISAGFEPSSSEIDTETQNGNEKYTRSHNTSQENESLTDSNRISSAQPLNTSFSPGTLQKENSKPSDIIKIATSSAPKATEDSRDIEAATEMTQPPTPKDQGLIHENPNSPLNSTNTIFPTESPKITVSDSSTKAPSTSTDISNTASVPPYDTSGDNGNSVRQFFADLKTHTVLCLISLLLLLLVGTVIFSFVLALFFTIKFSVIGIMKLCRVLRRCTKRNCDRNGGGVQDAGSLFPRNDVRIRAYDSQSRIPNDRDLY